MKASTILTLKQYAQSSQVGQNRLHLSLKEKKKKVETPLPMF